MIIKCKRCGQEIEGGNSRKYCDPCARKVRLEQMKAWQKKNRPKKEKVMMTCELCGKEIVRNKKTQRWCKECANLRTRPPRTIQCQMCGKEVVTTSSFRKYCDACAAEATKSRNLRYTEERRKKRLEQKHTKPKEKDESLCDVKKCRKCKYSWAKNSEDVFCLYIIANRHSRGCPAGKCDKFERG